MDGVSPVPNHGLPTHQIDAYGETGQWQLLQLPVGQVFSEHRIEVAAAVLVQQVPITPAGEPPKEPRELQIGGELAGAVIAIQTGAIKDPRHGPRARAGDHIDDDAVLFQGLEHTQVRHAAGGPAAQGDADANTPQVMHEAFHAVGQDLAPGGGKP